MLKKGSASFLLLNPTFQYKNACKITIFTQELKDLYGACEGGERILMEV